jgi:hypothetical protein
MAGETQLLWVIALGVAVAVLAVVILLLGLLRESVRSLGDLVAGVWSAAVGVFVHTVTAPAQLQKAATTLEAGLRGPNAVAGLRGPNAVAGLRGPNAVAGLRGPVAAR